MPKSGFDPQRHQRKLHRHNPLSSSSKSLANRNAANSPASASVVSSATLDALQGVAKATDGGDPSKTSASNDIVPLLANLADGPTAADAPSINLADKVWSLASVSLLLSVSSTQSAAQVKQHRKLLLAHNLVGRLIFALQSHTQVDVRREASGALRNLCVDAGIDVRNEVVNKGGVAAILAALRWASNALGFDSTLSSMSLIDDAPTPEQHLEAKRALLAKPLDKMNKKEKRQATKLATALAKTLEQVAGQALSADDERKLTCSHPLSRNGDANQSIDTSANTATWHNNRREPFLSLDSNTRRGLIETAENLVTLVWCLCESGDKAFAKLATWKWLDQDLVGAGAADQELSGQGLACWLSSAIALGSRAAAVLSTAPDHGSRAASNSSETLAVLSNQELSLLLDLALASGNALCALTDGGEADFLDGLLSRRTPSSPSKSAAAAAAGKKKGGKFDPTPAADLAPLAQSLSEQPAAATRCLTAIQSPLSLLEACVQTDQSNMDKLKRYILSQTTMLGVLSAGIFRNIAAAVDAKAASSCRGGKARKNAAPRITCSHIFLPIPFSANNAGGEGMTLKKYEESIVLPTLTRLLCGVEMTKLADDLDGRGDVDEAVSLDGTKDVDEAEVRAKMQAKAEEKAQTLMLALELLAEMAASFDCNANASAVGEEQGGDDEWLEDPDADQEEDEEMDIGHHCEAPGIQDKAQDQGEEGGDDDDMGLTLSRGDTFADAVKRTGTLAFTAYAPLLTSLVTTNSPSLISALLTLARPFEASFPSLTSNPGSRASGLLRGLHLRSLSVLNNLLLRLAAFSPPPPSQPATDANILRRIAAFRTWTQTPAQEESLKSIWTTLFEIARGCASVPAVANVSLSTPTDSIAVSTSTTMGEKEGKDGLGMVETCIGTLWSIARILQGSVPLSSPTPSSPTSLCVSDASAVSSEIITALITGYSSASTDGMRVKCILLLSTIARSPLVHPTLNAHIGTFLVSILESIAESPSESASGTNAESMIAAVNGIIDTYADEKSHYDALAFREAQLLSSIRPTLFRCKTLARSVDRRRHVSLREAAEEAVENLHAFIAYRQALPF
ncbi:hypothetical protein NDA10_004747 [Ustilago hordei]|nr:hypothetical protein NDA10_004747 [Ustilago hordei]KAJ1579145.1 hypothetical protein NDA15_006916 [Ustilago hordei]KAJ1580540.1 hypothetical protein NDA12_001413 [Ustilago hordei]